MLADCGEHFTIKLENKIKASSSRVRLFVFKSRFPLSLAKSPETAHLHSGNLGFSGQDEAVHVKFAERALSTRKPPAQLKARATTPQTQVFPSGCPASVRRNPTSVGVLGPLSTFKAGSAQFDGLLLSPRRRGPGLVYSPHAIRRCSPKVARCCYYPCLSETT